MEEPARNPIDIPHTQLSASALRGVLESFVLRDGTELKLSRNYRFALERLLGKTL